MMVKMAPQKGNGQVSDLLTKGAQERRRGYKSMVIPTNGQMRVSRTTSVEDLKAMGLY